MFQQVLSVSLPFFGFPFCVLSKRGGGRLGRYHEIEINGLFRRFAFASLTLTRPSSQKHATFELLFKFMMLGSFEKKLQKCHKSRRNNFKSVIFYYYYYYYYFQNPMKIWCPFPDSNHLRLKFKNHHQSFFL